MEFSLPRKETSNMEVFWFLPTHGDGRYLGSTEQARTVSYGYLKQIAQAADQLGFQGVLLPTGRSCEDAWVVASTLVPVTTKLKFLVAIRPGITSPTAAARMAATFDRLSEGRLLINVVTGGDPDEALGDGVFLTHDERYEVTEEFLQIWREAVAGNAISLNGKHLHVENAKVLYPAVQKPHPPLYFGGSSKVAYGLAARQVDVYLTWGEPAQAVEEQITTVRRMAEEQGRSVKFGIRLHVIVRETEKEAWDAANDLIRYVDDDTIVRAQKTFRSEGARPFSQVWHSPARDCSRDRKRSLGCGERSDSLRRRRYDRSGAENIRTLRLRRTAPHGGVESRRPRKAGGQSQSLGRRGIGARRRRHRAGWRSGHCSKKNAGVCRPGNRHLHFVWLSTSGRSISRGRLALSAPAHFGEIRKISWQHHGPIRRTSRERTPTRGNTGAHATKLAKQSDSSSARPQKGES